MSQQGRLKDIISSLETLTGNTGGAVNPDPAGNINVVGTAGTIVSGNPGTFTLTIDASGGLVFTTGSVIFMGVSELDQDNANFFWDNTNNRLGLGTDIPLETLDIAGTARLTYTATEDGDVGVAINCDSAGFTDFKCVSIVHTTGDVAPGETEESILINIDEISSTGGNVFGVEVLSTSMGLTEVHSSKSGVGVNPILQNSGLFENADSILNIAVDVLAALSSGGAGNVSVFVADNDTMTIGRATTFAEIEFIIDTPASAAGIAPIFEFSTGIGTWAAFSPADGTNGMRNSGIIDWDISSIPTWAVGTGSEFLIRITRTRNFLVTTPILDEVQVGGVAVFSWDKDGNVIINSLNLTEPLTPANGGRLAWTVITANQSAVVNNGYICNKATALELLLPATAIAGDIIRVTGINTALGIKITQNADQQIHLGTGSTTIGVGGFLQSTAIRDSLEMVAVVAGTSTIWNVLSTIGSWSIS